MPDFSISIIAALSFILNLLSFIPCNTSNNIIGLSIPLGGGKKIIEQSLKTNGSEFSRIIDIDQKINLKSHIELDASIFKAGLEYIESVLDIEKQVSKNSLTPLVMSRNFKMLKYMKCKKVYYFLGTQSYYSALKLTMDDQNTLQEYKNFLISEGKMNKVITYSSIEELQNILCKMFGLSHKV